MSLKSIGYEILSRADTAKMIRISPIAIQANDSSSQVTVQDTYKVSLELIVVI